MADGEVKTGADQVVYDGGVSAAKFTRQSHHRGGGLAGGGPNTEKGKGLPWYRSRGGDMEGDGGIEEHHRCFGLGGHFMAAVLAAASYSRIGFSV